MLLGELCRARCLKYFVEGYGQGVFDEMHVSGLPDVPMGEFWTRTPWAPNRTAKMVASAAHIYGKRVVGAEAFTGVGRFWQSGHYTWSSGGAAQVEVPTSVPARGGWRVRFAPDRGAPPAIDLPALTSLERHSDPGVKYFSGTAAYTCTLHVPAEFVGDDKRVVLDLRRVEVLATVVLNGRALGERMEGAVPARRHVRGARRGQCARGTGHESVGQPVDRRRKPAS